MYPTRIEYLAEVARELDDALGWYRERSPKAAETFLAHLERGLDRILDRPRTWPRYAEEVRRYVLPGFPYSVLYRGMDRGITLVALAHHKREPSYWADRRNRKPSEREPQLGPENDLEGTLSP